MSDDRSLPRTERLRSLGAVRRLFESGESGFVFPFRYVWFAEADSVPSVEVLLLGPQEVPQTGEPAESAAPPHQGGLPAAKRDRPLRRTGQSRPGPHLLLEGGAALQNHRTCGPPDSGNDRGASLGGSAPCRSSCSCASTSSASPPSRRRRAASPPPARNTRSRRCENTVP